MRLKPAGRFALLILIAGIAFGIWRWYRMSSGGKGSGLPSLTQGLPQKTDREGVAPGATGEAAPSGSSGGDLVLITSATKRGWLEEQVDRFNGQQGGKMPIHVRYVETRAAMQAILAGKEKPVLWSPSSPIWAQRLSEAWSLPEFHHGSDDPVPVELNDTSRFRIYLRSPLVFLTTKARATYLRPLLGGQDPWGSLRDLSLGRRKVPGQSGPFRFAHADPLSANSGFLTIAMILSDYVRRHGGSPETVANSAAFIQYLTELEHGLVYDDTVRGGSSAIFKAFLDDPSRYGVITTYESNALEAAASYPDLVVIYPIPTVVSEQTVVSFGGSWVTPEERAEARAFLDFLAQPESIAAGAKSHSRPVSASSGASLDAELDGFRDRGFRKDFRSVDPPNYAALNAAAYQWRLHVAHLSATDAAH